MTPEQRRTGVRAAVGLAAVGVLAAGLSASPWTGEPPPVERPAPWTENRMALTLTGGAAPLLLPDGTAVEIGLPGEDWAGLSAYPYAAISLTGVAGRDLVVPRGGLAWFDDQGTRERDLPAPDGVRASVWAADGTEGPDRYLVVEAGPWVFGVWDRAEGAAMTDAQLTTLAAHLGATVKAGFLQLVPERPVRVTNATLEAGSPAAVDGTDPAGLGLTVLAESCATRTLDVGGDDPGTAVLCRPDWPVTLLLRGPRAVLERAAREITVRRV